MFGKKKSAGGGAELRPKAEASPEPRPARETYPASPLPGHRGSGIMTPGVSRRPSASLPTQPTPMATPENEGRKLVVGREISLSGQIKACEKLVVEGKVEADLTDSSFLEISATGLFVGNARVTDCDISGTFEGELTVTGWLRLRATGLVRGKLRYHEMETERGGRLIGAVDVLGPEAEVPQETVPEKTAPEKAAPEKADPEKSAAVEDETAPTAGDAKKAAAKAKPKAAGAKRPRGIKGLVDQEAQAASEANAGEKQR